MSGPLTRHGVPAVAVTLALVLLSAVGVAALQPGAAGAATVLVRGAAVVVELPDGTSRPLAEGQEVPRDAVVRAGRDGALLRTRDRDTWLGGEASVLVRDGARQVLQEGFVMVDARRGPALSLSTAAGEVTTPEGAVSRVQRGALLRVGSYAGDPLAVRAEGRRATTDVSANHQVQVPDGGLPGAVTPLVLTSGDSYERALAPSLVMADEALGDIARRLDAGGVPGTAVAQAVSTGVPAAAPVPAGAPASERTLAYLLAAAAEGDTLADRYDRVRALRSAGGSWGVVAALVDADVAEVATQLDALLADDAPAVAAAEDVDLAELLGVAPPPATTTPSGGTPDPPAPPVSAPAPPAPTPPAPTPPAPGGDEPDAPPSLTDPVETVVEQVVEQVLDALGGTPARESDVLVPALPGDPVPALP